MENEKITSGSGCGYGSEYGGGYDDDLSFGGNGYGFGFADSGGYGDGSGCGFYDGSGFGNSGGFDYTSQAADVGDGHSFYDGHGFGEYIDIDILIKDGEPDGSYVKY